ncbi:hypothetical protein [Lactiplantibacillus plantarum]|uniref:hypothetical protein n=1 Tax=Lactiplantibacillus plantarum TaxID=1590 RepID=UPI000FF8E74F|nr:hypothetical protein [Lactiplantibacillus plantarum]MCS6093941.1 hypothetical protein [Lactobacillus sp. LMY-20]MBX0340525.1 hypothetical protein [Lactiplantibacillus plantarum]MCG0662338.1 SinR family protein [Lactiplantibacillus plantarum]MCG0694889.1 SinR family protein [Lactiplantibacillus plantarum]MCG0698008.1 SinR family protein [Lactiplantibacillus plantarum]
MNETSKFVAFELLNSGQRYDALYKLLKSFSTHRKITESLWMVNTSLTPAKLRDTIKPCLDENDHLFIIDYVSGSRSAWFNTIDDFKDALAHEDDNN